MKIFNPAQQLCKRPGFLPAGDRGVYLLMERLPLAALADSHV